MTSAFPEDRQSRFFESLMPRSRCMVAAIQSAASLRFLRRQRRVQPKGLREQETQAIWRAAGQTGHGLARRN
jgi:hypothetical protein